MQCLAGCVFTYIESETEKDLSLNENNHLETWKNLIVKYGGQFEETYSSTCTHIICDTQEHNLVRQVSFISEFQTFVLLPISCLLGSEGW